MKLELNGLTASPSLEKSTREPSTASTATTAPSTTPVAEDRTTFRSKTQTVQSLVDKAGTTPELRQDKIDAIKQSISDGTYKFDANKVANAIIADSKEF